MLNLALLIVHIATSLVLVLVVLLQTGKRADLAGAFGGGGSQTAFGARGAATLLSKATTWSAVLFMVTSVLLGIRFGRESTQSVVQEPSSGSATAPPAPTIPQPVPIQPPAGAPAPGGPGGSPAPEKPASGQPPAGEQPPAGKR